MWVLCKSILIVYIGSLMYHFVHPYVVLVVRNEIKILKWETNTYLMSMCFT